MTNTEDLIDVITQELQYQVEWFSYAEAKDIAERVFDVWDKAYGGFETYDMFDQQGDLFDERQPV